jgi:hypothetical protein
MHVAIVPDKLVTAKPKTSELSIDSQPYQVAASGSNSSFVPQSASKV